MLANDKDLKSILDAMTLEEKTGQILMVPPTEELIRDLCPGSILVRNHNADDDFDATREMVASLQHLNGETSRFPLWMHGFVYLPPWTPPRDGEIAEKHTVSETEGVFFEIGRKWRDMGFHTYPSPTVNIHMFDTGIMPKWAISKDPETTTQYSRAITRGLIRARCGTMAQHFPAHGATAVDSHAGVPVIDLNLETLMRDHIPPYTASFEEGCTTICAAHLKCPALDPDESNIATTSRAILVDFLRGRLGFEGVTIADAIQMEGFKAQGDQGETCVRAVIAGCDCICIPFPDELAVRVFETLLKAAQSGQLSAERLNDAVVRNLAFKRWAGIL